MQKEIERNFCHLAGSLVSAINIQSALNVDLFYIMDGACSYPLA